MGIEQIKPAEDTKEETKPIREASEEEEELIEDKTDSDSNYEKCLIWLGLVGGTDLLTTSVVSGLMIYNEDIKKIFLNMNPSVVAGAGVLGFSLMGLSTYFYFKDKTVEKKD